ncbi:DUF2336 domain-containing protein [Nordella sp. HKS 07]|uniref:DUF2336 domain-containing protein n=1 Tax=Nordella sp. HKS 07 TaxID=2712222 RepID=UPI0013E11A7E|nr:DUF2336 domain-containing protein [Nordella sp. HKS 07]QIG51575.1 DUF2336 domain-containing protein [Nordella sp. HKS 07]
MKGQPGLDVSIFDMIVETGDVQARMQLAVELAGLVNDAEAPENERDCVVPSLLKLASDPVKEVRRVLAETLVTARYLHGDILFSIVADDDDIALAFLAETPALDHWKMRSIVRVGDTARQVTLAQRPDLDDDVIKEIATQADIAACLALFDNAQCTLSERNCRILYARFGRVQEIIDRLLALDTLPLDIRVLQAKRASNQVHQLMAERGWVPANDAADMVADAEERAILQILDSANDLELPSLIRFMTSRNMLNASIIMRSACAGNMRIVEVAMAHLANVSLAKAQDALYGGSSAFNSLYRGSGLPQTCIGLLRAAGQVERELRDAKRILSDESFGRRLIEQIMTGDGAMSAAERAKYLDIVGRYSSDRVRVIASRLREGLVSAA